ncbi:MAG: hypothetical protein R3279_03195 [Putridiphycobacter sp.]|nr:hypothetical protein [Putridiphycobacter sp.]
MKRNVIILCTLIMTVISCKNDSDDRVIAEVYEFKLTAGMLAKEFKKNKITSDSAQFANSYIKNWINDKTIVHFALKENIAELNDIEEKVNNYKNQLLIHFYQNKHIQLKLDTVVTDAEIKAYYQSHKPDFQLKDYLVKVLYLKVSEDAPEIENLANWYHLKNEEDEQNIIQYAGLYASNFYFDKNNWIYFDEITKEIPLTDINKDRFITQKSDVKFLESNYYYFFNIIDYKLKNSVSPIEFEKENIKERILNKRIHELRETIQNELINKAENENAIKQY